MGQLFSSRRESEPAPPTGRQIVYTHMAGFRPITSSSSSSFYSNRSGYTSTRPTSTGLENSFGRLSTNDDTGIPVYMLSVGDKKMFLFEPSREQFLEAPAQPPSAFKQGEIYNVSSIQVDRLIGLTTLTTQRRNHYLTRDKLVYGSERAYRELILPALLLGSRVRDFEQRCAVVDQLGTVVLTIPPQNARLETLKLKTIEGNTFEIDVKFVKKGEDDQLDKKWFVTCHPPKEPLPAEVSKGSQLEILDTHNGQPRVTAALMATHVKAKTAPIENWNLFACIYGPPGCKDYPVPQLDSPFIHLANNKGRVKLNAQQVEAVARYNCESCPAFVVESPPGSGKTMTAAAMAVSYRGKGIQLFLSTANVPVINMALALGKLDIGTLKAIHLISAEREALMTEETRSPFSVLSLARNNEQLKTKIAQLELEMKCAPNDELRERTRIELSKTCARIYADSYDIFFATVDTILGRRFKVNQSGKHRPDGIKEQLTNRVRRIVVDEASQLTEAALNALILCFPHAQIVLIGDSKQLPPFKYTKGEVVSALAARSALEVCKDKMNLPVTKLTIVYRASKELIAHYSNVFYGGVLVSGKAESANNPLSCFGARSAGTRRLFWKVNGRCRQAGTSKVNDSEINDLKYLINILRQSGYNEKSVMIISYYEAQRKKAEEEFANANLKQYEMLTVDSAQGREKKIVIVMTTRTSVPVDSGAFFSCPLRCNVAVSRHQEALIVLGHDSIASAPNWANVLSPKYFKPVEPFTPPARPKPQRRRGA